MDKPSSLLLSLKEWARLRSRRTWLEPRPVYVAAALAATAALVMLVVASGVKQPVPPRDLAAVRPPAAEQPAAATATGTQAPAAVRAVEKAPPRDEAPRRPLAGEVRLAFGWQLHPLYGDWRYHPGLDIVAATGSPVRAVWSGRVTEVFRDDRYGLTVALVGGGYTVFYGSLAAAKADKGQTVAAGTVVGTVGEARSEPYPHLHLAIKKGDNYIDPREILAGAK